MMSVPRDFCFFVVFVLLTVLFAITFSIIRHISGASTDLPHHDTHYTLNSPRGQ